MKVASNLTINELISSLSDEQLVALIEALKNEETTEELFDAAMYSADEIRGIS